MSIDAKIAEARTLLGLLGMDQVRTNIRSARVFVSLLGLRPSSPWRDAENHALGNRAIMDWIRDHYGFEYKPNSRESIRRFTLHQFVDSHLALLNPDDPTRPTNSQDNVYQVTDEAVAVIRAFGTPAFGDLLSAYLAERPGLQSIYAAERAMERIPVTLPGGAPFTLSPGGQNVLLAQMIADFCPRFTPGGEVLYIGDAGDKWAVYEKERLALLGVELDEHGKMPDLVVYMPEKNWLVLLEAASTHGPVDSKRHGELAKLFERSTAGLVYVSCFPSKRTMRKYLSEIAWETDAWCADHPTHMVHFNGERFLGPYA